MMSPAQFNDQNAKKEMIVLTPLKVNKDSHLIKKSSPTSSSSSSSSSLVNGIANVINKFPQQRHPVIIYTHSPKVIHTHPKDFMALVQKLTGLSRSDNDQNHPPPQMLEQSNEEFSGDHNNNNNIVNNKGLMNDDNESTSVVTDEYSGGSTLGDAQINSCFDHPPNPCFNDIPFFNPNSTDFLCTNQPFYNNSDSFFLVPTNIKSSFPSSTLDGMKELPEF